MRSRIKHISSFALIPLTRWYLRKERKYQYKGIQVTVRPGVFHPGLFHSTKFLIDYLSEHSLRNKTLLELGCGTGLLSIFAAKSGARVSASDLSIAAIGNTEQNAVFNKVSIQTIHSDLFDRIDRKTFDWIMINPPYYAKDPSSDAELAWYCGQDFEYYKRLFASLSGYMHATSNVIMVTTMGSDLETIFSIARDHQFHFQLIKEKKVLFDGKDFLYRINRMPPRQQLPSGTTEHL